MTVLDASVVIAALVDDGHDGDWAADLLSSDPLAAPHLLPVEAANVLRRAVAAGDLSDDVATLAHSDLGRIPFDLFAYAPLAPRVWELRRNVRPYDAWYVALAESLDAPLATLDSRLTRATGPRCEFLTPG